MHENFFCTGLKKTPTQLTKHLIKFSLVQHVTCTCSDPHSLCIPRVFVLVFLRENPTTCQAHPYYTHTTTSTWFFLAGFFFPSEKIYISRDKHRAVVRHSINDCRQPACRSTRRKENSGTHLTYSIRTPSRSQTKLWSLFSCSHFKNRIDFW